MFHKGYGRRVFSLFLAFVLLLSVSQVNGTTAQAADTGTAIDISKEVTTQEVKDTALLAALKTIIKGDAAANMTLGELTSYEGEIDLTPYADTITRIEGLGYARKATKIDFSAIKNMTEIPDYEFDGCNATEIRYPDSVTKIGNASFKKCKNLQNVDLANILEIGEMAFQGCEKLEGITFHPQLKEIGKDGFSNCLAITSIVIENPAIKMGANTFAECKGLESIVLPEGLEEIPIQFLRGTKKLQSITIPSSLKVISGSAFYDSGISQLDFTHCTNLTDIKQYAFAGAKIIKIELPDSVERIDTCAFNASALYSIRLPEGLVSLGAKAFSDCKILSEVTINDSLTAIDEGTFNECHALEKVNISENSKLESIGSKAFRECYSLPGTQFLSRLKNLKTIESYAFAECFYQVEKETDRFGLAKYAGEFSEVILPDSLEILGEGAFSNSKMIEKAELGEGIIVLPTSLFEGCGQLKEVVLPQKLQIIGSKAFKKCKELAKIELPDGLKEIQDSAFENCGTYSRINGELAQQYYVLKEKITTEFETGLQKVYYYVNAENEEDTDVANCTYKVLKTGYVKSEELSDVEAGDSISVYVATGEHGTAVPCIKGYEATGLQSVEIPDSVEVIGKNAFANCVNLETVDLSRNLKILSDYAFSGCGYQVYVLKKENNTEKLETAEYQYKGLRDVTFYENLEQIGNYTFRNCYNFNLDQGKLPSTLQTIGDSVFENCKSLTRVVIPPALTTIGNRAFYGSSEEIADTMSDGKQIYRILEGHGLQEVNYENAINLTSIGSYAFYHTAITNVSLPQGITKINSRTFEGCWFLKTVELPSTVTAVGDNAFKDCKEISSLILPASATLDNTMLSGYTNSANIVVTNEEAIQVECNGGEAILPLYICNKNTANADAISISYVEGTDLDLTYEILERNDGVYYVKLIGINPSEVKIEVICSLKFPNSITNINSVTVKLPYTVSVTGVPCQSVEFEEEPYVVAIDNMTKGLNLSARINPEDCTDLLKWSIESDKVVGLAPVMADSNIGSIETSQANVKPINYGSEKVTLKAGAVSKDTYVNVVVPASSLSVAESTINLYLGIEDTKTISAACQYNTNTYAEDKITNYPDIVKYTSDHPEIATVDQNGNVTAVSPGEAKVTVTALGGYGMGNYTARKVVTVVVSSDLEKIQLTDVNTNEVYNEDTVLSVEAKSTMKLGITTNPLDSKAELVATADDESYFSNLRIVSDRKLEFTPQKLGRTYLYVQPKVSNHVEAVQAKIGVEVYAEVTAMKLNENRTVNIGESLQVMQYIQSAMGRTGNATEISSYTTDKVVFSSNDTRIASVDTATGQVTGVSEGSTTITVTWTNRQGISKSASTTVNVAYPLATNVTLDGPDKLKIGETATYTANVVPATAKQEVIYELFSGESLELVDGANGVFRAVNPGTSRIRAITSNGKIAYLNVAVTSPATSVTQNLSELTIKKGGGYTISASDYIIQPSNHTDSITWSSLNQGVATVTAAGRIVGVGKGTTTILGTLNETVKISISVTVLLPATGISFDKTAITVDQGKTASILAKVTPLEHTDEINWVSNDNGVATVDANGVVTGKAPGTCRITATTTSGKYAICNITVKSPATSVTTGIANVTINKGTSYTIAASDYTVAPVNHTDKIIWSSLNVGVATVSTTGRITGVAKGTTTIIGTFNENVRVSIQVTVMAPATSVSVNKNSVTINKGKKVTIGTNVSPSEHTDQLTWKSSNTSIATVSQTGVITGKAAGTCRVTVTTTSGKSATCTVTVKLPATSVKINTVSASNKTIYMVKGKSYGLSATMSPVKTTDRVTWSSNKKSVATVNASTGKVIAKKKGTATITCKTTSGKKTTIKIVVVAKEAKATKVKLPSSKSVRKGKSIKLIATVTKSSSTDTLSWSTSKKAVATVDRYGNVTGKKKGTCYITVRTTSGKTAKCKIKVK